MKTKKRGKSDDENSRAMLGSVELPCPFCGTLSQVTLDEGGGSHQMYIEDCDTCCKPRVVHLDASGTAPNVWLERSD